MPFTTVSGKLLGHVFLLKWLGFFAVGYYVSTKIQPYLFEASHALMALSLGLPVFKMVYTTPAAYMTYGSGSPFANFLVFLAPILSFSGFTILSLWKWPSNPFMAGLDTWLLFGNTFYAYSGLNDSAGDWSAVTSFMPSYYFPIVEAILITSITLILATILTSTRAHVIKELEKEGYQVR